MTEWQPTSRMRETGAKWTAKRKLVYERDGGVCQVCGDMVDWEYYELGHKVDLTAGGNNDLDNLALMCIACNRLKPAHDTLEEYDAWARNGGPYPEIARRVIEKTERYYEGLADKNQLKAWRAWRNSFIGHRNG